MIIIEFEQFAIVFCEKMDYGIPYFNEISRGMYKGGIE